uniref:Uncharacterized protein n=1 Tax=viral metagenome TaxID=1070528 RepID=A0A6C0C9F5_9ZZZZ
MLLFLLSLLFIAIQSQTACGFDRTTIIYAPGSSCSSKIVESDCLSSVALDITTGQSYKCLFSAGTCSQDTTACKPSCFLGDRHPVSPSCSYSTCNSEFIGGYGNSQICYMNYLAICTSIPCDFSCTGYVTVSSCSGLTQAQCKVSQIHSATGDNNCAWDGFGCVMKEECIKICDGVYSTSDCTTVSPVGDCEQYYELHAGNLKYDCQYGFGSCSSTYSNGKCYFPGAGNCGGTIATSCSSFITKSTCNARYILDGGIGGTYRQCGWTSGAGCFPNKPCKH